MPLYEYQCTACEHRFEKIQKVSDPLVQVCPVCGGQVQKLLSSPAFQFKGSGWYITDYAKKSAKGDGSKSDGAKSDGAKADGAKADSAKESTGKAETPSGSDTKTESKPKAEPKSD